MKKYLPLVATTLFALSQSPLYGMYHENSFFESFNTEENNLAPSEQPDFFASLNIPSNIGSDSNSSLDENEGLIRDLDDSEIINNAVPTATEEELSIKKLLSDFISTKTPGTVHVQNLTTPQNSGVPQETTPPSKKHSRENNNKRLKNQSKQKKIRLNNHTTNSTNFSSSSKESFNLLQKPIEKLSPTIQDSKPLNASSTSQNQQLPASTPLTQPQTTSTHPQETQQKPTKNQPPSKSPSQNTAQQSMDNSTTTSSNSSQSITTRPSSSTSSTTKTWTEYQPSDWNQRTWNINTPNKKVQIIANLLNNAETSTEILDKIKLKLDQLIQIPRSSLDCFLNAPGKSKTSIVQQAINKNNNTGLIHLRFILNFLNNKIHSLKKYENHKKNYQLLANKLTECTTDNTTLECSELVKNVKNAINNTLKEKMSVETKASIIFDELGKLLNGPTQPSNALNVSLSSQNQLLPTATPTQPQITTTITHPQEMQKTQQKPTKNQSLFSQPLQKKQNTSQQSIANSATTNSSSSQSITIGPSSSTSSTPNAWTGYPPSHWNQKNWNNLGTIREKTQIIADLLQDAETSTKMLDEIKEMFDRVTRRPGDLIKWSLNPSQDTKNSAIQQAINKNNNTGLIHLMFIFNILNSKLCSSETHRTHVERYEFLAQRLKKCTLTNTTPACSNLVNSIRKAIENPLKEQLSPQTKVSKIFNALNQLLNGPIQLSNSLNASTCSQYQLLPTTTLSTQPQTTTTITHTNNSAILNNGLSTSTNQNSIATNSGSLLTQIIPNRKNNNQNTSIQHPFWYS